MLTDRGLQRGELLLEHLDDKWRQAFRRLVEEQDLGVHHHRAGDGEHVLLAAAQRARPLVSPVRRALTGAAPVSCSASMRGGCTRIRLRLSPRCHQRFDGWLRRERISSGKSANYLSTQNPCASMPSAVLNLLRKFSSAIAAVSSTICASLKWRRSRPWSASVTRCPVTVIASAYSIAAFSLAEKSGLVAAVATCAIFSCDAPACIPRDALTSIQKGHPLMSATRR